MSSSPDYEQYVDTLIEVIQKNEDPRETDVWKSLTRQQKTVVMNKVRAKLVLLAPSLVSSTSSSAGSTIPSSSSSSVPISHESAVPSSRKRGRPKDEPSTSADDVAATLSSSSSSSSATTTSSSSSTSSTFSSTFPIHSFRTIVSHMMYVSGEQSASSLSNAIVDEVTKDTLTYLKYILRTLRIIQGTDNVRVGDFAKLMPETLRAYFRWKTLKELAQPEEEGEDPSMEESGPLLSSSENSKELPSSTLINFQYYTSSSENSSSTSSSNNNVSVNQSSNDFTHIDINDEIKENFLTESSLTSSSSSTFLSAPSLTTLDSNTTETESQILHSTESVTIPPEDAEELKQLQELQDAADEELRTGIYLPSSVASSTANDTTTSASFSSSATAVAATANDAPKNSAMDVSRNDEADPDELQMAMQNSSTMKLFYARLYYFNQRSLHMTTKEYADFEKSREIGFTGTGHGRPSGSSTSILQSFAGIFPTPTPSRTTLEILAYLGYDRIAHIVETTANLYLEKQTTFSSSTSSSSSSSSSTHSTLSNDPQYYLTTYPFPLPNNEENSVTFPLELYQKALTILPKLPPELTPLLTSVQANVHKRIEKDHLKLIRESEYQAIIKDKEQLASINAKWASGVHDRQGDSIFLSTMQNLQQTRKSGEVSSTAATAATAFVSSSSSLPITLHNRPSPLSLNRTIPQIVSVADTTIHSLPGSTDAVTVLGNAVPSSSSNTSSSSFSLLPGVPSLMTTVKPAASAGRLKSIIHRT